MGEKRLTAKRREILRRNFNKEACDRAMEPLLKIYKESHSIMELFQKTRDYWRDTECYEDGILLRAEVELDRTDMETTADYVGISVYFFEDYETKEIILDLIELYTTDTPDGIVEPICFLDPVTYKPLKWVSESM